MRPPFWFPFLLLAFPILASPYGLNTRPVVEKYFDGVFPSNPPGENLGIVPATLSATGLFVDLKTLRASPKLLSYEINLGFWSEGAEKKRWVALPLTSQIEFSETEGWGWPEGTVFVKHFDFRSRRLETRVLVVLAGQETYGLTYRWREDHSDADLLVTGSTETLLIEGERLQWHFPSGADCRRCHTPVAGGVLGPRAAQLQKERHFSETGIVDNQIRAWNHVGFFSTSLPEKSIPAIERLVTPTEENETMERRVKSYLAVNCASCHRPGSEVQAIWDARYETPLSFQRIINGPVLDKLGIEGAKVVVPGDLTKSIIYRRMSMVDLFVMPPVGHHRIDEEGLRLIARWIQSL